MSDFPNFSIKELLDSGAHFGHKTMRWNPKMAPYIYGDRDGIHIIDLQKTAILLHRALLAVESIMKQNGRILFVGTKRQASDIISESAKRCGQYYINHRWLGGMLTNWNTISNSIKTLKKLEEQVQFEKTNDASRVTKKELLQLERRHDKLELSLGGIREMGGRPDLLFILDTNKEELAIKEAQKLSIPIIAIVDTNSNPDGIDFPIPGNDDATRAIRLYCQLIADAALHGMQQAMVASGVDIGAAENAGDSNQEAGANRKNQRKTTTRKFAGKQNKISAADTLTSTAQPKPKTDSDTISDSTSEAANG
jgi:small subunit ribosomal protein S2